VRKVQADCAIEVDGNAYSVPWRLIGETLRFTIAGERMRVSLRRERSRCISAAPVGSNDASTRCTSKGSSDSDQRRRCDRKQFRHRPAGAAASF
jgi:hypothetical protein